MANAPMLCRHGAIIAFSITLRCNLDHSAGVRFLAPVATRGPVTPGEDRYIPHDPRNIVFLKAEQQCWRDESLRLPRRATGHGERSTNPLPLPRATTSTR